MRFFKIKRVYAFIDKLSFIHIFSFWAILVIIFGLLYFYFEQPGTFLLYNAPGNPTIDLKDTVYFSFIAATTTGFGDIIPFGFFKIIAVIEVILGLMLLAMVTSKLVSIKQDVILSEIYELSLNEKVNGLRSSLLLFRQNLERLITKIEEGKHTKREINNLYVYINSFVDTLNDTFSLIKNSRGKHFIKSIDPVNTELLFHSIIASFEKLNELLTSLTEHEINWKQELNSKTIYNCISINEKLFEDLNFSKTLMKETVLDLNVRKDSTLGKTLSFIKSE